MNESASPPPMPNGQAVQDAEHLKLLAIFHYVSAGLSLLAACFASLFVVLGVAMSGMPRMASSPAEAELIGWLFAVVGGVMAAGFLAMAVVEFLAGRYLTERRNHGFIFVISCLQCLNVPLGTALGVCTIVVLQRPSVKALFEGRAEALGALG